MSAFLFIEWEFSSEWIVFSTIYNLRTIHKFFLKIECIFIPWVVFLSENNAHWVKNCVNNLFLSTIRLFVTCGSQTPPKNLSKTAMCWKIECCRPVQVTTTKNCFCCCFCEKKQHTGRSLDDRFDVSYLYSWLNGWL